MAKKKSLSKIQIELNNAVKEASYSNEAKEAAAKNKTAAKRAKKAQVKAEDIVVSDYKYEEHGAGYSFDPADGE